MAHDDRTTRLPQAGPSQEGGDVGGIPSTLNQGVDHASDRSAGRRDGTLESDAGGGMPASLPVSQDSAALPSRPARDKTAPALPADPGAGKQAEPATMSRSGTPGADRDRGSSANAQEAGSDDSLAQSLGKAISEPFKSD